MATLAQLEAGVKKAYDNGNLEYARILGAQLVEARKEKSNSIPGGEVAGTSVKNTEQPGIIDKAIGTGEAALTAATGATGGMLGLAGGTIGGVAGSIANGEFGTPEGARRAEEAATNGMQALTYVPRTESGQQQAAVLGEAMNNLIPLAGVAPEVAAITQAAKPAAVQAVQALKQGGAKALTVGKQAAATAMENIAGNALPEAAVASAEAPAYGSVGAAGANPFEVARATAANASPELRAEVERMIKKKEPINQKALENHVEAETLDVPVRLSQGQATEDPILISQEKNSRGKNPEYIERSNANNQALIENLNVVRERQAPDVFLQTPLEHGDAMISAYQSLDDGLRQNIRGLYKQLEDANGGQFPIDPAEFVKQAEANLQKKNRNHFLPSEVRNIINTYKDGAPMTFNDFEELRTILAAESRKAERAGDGNRAMAISAVRQALEDMPLSNATDQIKQIADAARTAARSRFAMIEADPAYKAVVNEKANGDNFISKYVIHAPTNKVETLLQHLGQTDDARQVLASALTHYLKNAARVSNDSGTFAQASYNNALAKINPKVAIVFGEDAGKLQSVGNVARLLKQQTEGSYVNNSNTAVQLVAGTALDKIPGVNIAKSAFDKVKEAKQVKKSLRAGAGISQKESKLLEVRRKVEAKAAEKQKQKRK